jgi:hypothetical protein
LPIPAASDHRVGMNEILILADGFDVIDGRSGASMESRMRWSDVGEIIGFKIDLGTYDTIRLGIRSATQDQYIELDEDWTGFNRFVEEIERRFDVSRDWWSHVAFPAFATNTVTLWPKSPAPRN